MTDDIPLVIADANVLFPAVLRDTIFRISESGLARVRLSDAIWNEVTRNLLSTGRMTADALARLNGAARAFFDLEDMLVTGYESLEPLLTCDPKDRHVLAAAIHAHAESIITLNIKDFPAASLAPYDIDVETPDAFLLRQHATDPGRLSALLRRQAADKTRPPQTLAQLLDTLARHAPQFVARIRTDEAMGPITE